MKLKAVKIKDISVGDIKVSEVKHNQIVMTINGRKKIRPIEYKGFGKRNK